MTDHSDLIERLETCNQWLLGGNCCGEVDSSGTCLAPACTWGDALKEMHNAAAALREQQEALEIVSDALQKLPGGFWETWTSCSFRRISKRGGADGSVLHAKIQRSDGHPDLSWSESECEAICVLVNTLRAALGKDGA